jgi:hypothetical protein
MMAKMFYTLEETKVALGKTEEEIRQFAREGRLREFRDGPRLMFKADQVDQLKGDMSSGMRTDMGGSDSGAAVGMQDIGASGSGVISLADTDFGKSPGAALVKEDTALAADLGLSGSLGGVPSPSRSNPGSGTSAGTRAGGITVFDVDDAHKADPSAQTAIGSGIQDQVNLEGVGSGSGLLDLTRESDDTSLGAELLDEMGPASTATAATLRRPAQQDSGVGMDQLSGGVVNRSRLAAPVFVEAADPLAGAFGGLALFGALIVLFGGFVLANAIFGVSPELVRELNPASANSKGMLYLGGAAIGAVVFFAVGWVVGKATSR